MMVATLHELTRWKFIALLRHHAQTLLALVCLAVGTIGLLDALLEAETTLSSVAFSPVVGGSVALFGLALLGYYRGALLLCRGAALALFALATLDLLPRLTGLSLLVQPPAGGASWGPPAMSAMFALMGIGLLAASVRGTGRVLARLCGGLLLLAGLGVLLASWLDVTGATSHFAALFNHHQVGAASALLLASGVSLLVIDKPVRAPSPCAPAHLSLAAGALSAVIACGGWYWLSQQNLSTLAQQSEQQLDRIQATTERALVHHTQLMQRQADRWTSLGRLPGDALWQQESRSYLGDFASLELVAVLDDDLDPARLAATSGEARDWLTRYLDTPRHARWLHQERHLGGNHLGPVQATADGRPLALIALPLPLGDATDHWLVAGVDLATLLHPQIDLDIGDFLVQIEAGDTLLLRSQPNPSLAAGPRFGLREITFPHGESWRIISYLDHRTLMRLTALPTLLLLAGLLLGLLLMLSLTLFRLGERSRRHLDASHQALQQAFHQRDQFLTLSPELFARIDLEGRFLQASPAFESQLGYSPDQLVGEHYSRLIREEDHPAAEDAIARLRRGEAIRGLELRGWDAGGELHWVEINAALGEEAVIYLVARDITERKQREEQLRLLERSVESSINGVLIVDVRQPQQPILYVNPAFERITGYRRDEVIGRNCRFLQGEQTEPSARRALREGIASGRDTHVVLHNYRKDGTPFWNELYISPVRDAAGVVTHFIGVQNDISTQREVQSQLAFHASHDALTGLPNRTLLEDRLIQGCRIARRYRRHLAVLFVDLDGFKPINDSLGHAFGDQLLIEIAQRLAQGLRPGDSVARLGNDEFVVLLPDLAREDDVIPVAERLLACTAAPCLIKEHELHVTASIGIALSNGDIESPMQLVQQADLAMVKAKRQGRNNFQWYTHDLEHKARERVALRNALQRAIEEQQFELHYQPQVHGPSGRILGFEALLRWHHPERGYVSPADFIGLAEETGQIIAIGDWVLTTACRDARRLNTLGLGDFTMAVNISPMQFQRGGFIEGVLEALAASGLPAEHLELELTEGMLMGKTECAIATLQALREHGLHIAIDDFGTGFSSLGYLKHLPIDKIKIDRSFIREVISDHRDAAIVQGVASMATQLGLRLVAEGVETEAQCAYLGRHHCDTFQGYHFARPMRLNALIPFVAEHARARSLDQARRNGEQGGQTLLLLDDEANILRALKRALRRDGYRILTADTVWQAFELLATEEVQVIISDQRMPEMSGTEFLRRVTRLHPEAVQIVLSGYTDLKTVTAAINEGAVYKFLTKPWDDDELRLVVQQAFRRAATASVAREGDSS